MRSHCGVPGVGGRVCHSSTRAEGRPLVSGEFPFQWSVFRHFWYHFLVVDSLNRNYRQEYEDYCNLLAEQLQNTHIAEKPKVYSSWEFSIPQYQVSRAQNSAGSRAAGQDASHQPGDHCDASRGSVECGRLEFFHSSLRGFKCANAETVAIAVQEKAKLFDELHQHYLTILGAAEAPNYAKRIATISSIIHTVDVREEEQEKGLDGYPNAARRRQDPCAHQRH